MKNGRRTSWSDLPENTSCSIVPSFLEQPLFINGLTAESCEQRTWTCLKNCPVKSKRSAQDTVPTSVFSGRQLKNALKKLKHGKRSVIGKSTRSWETRPSRMPCC